MDRYAVLVDSGYFAAAGQWAVSGQQRPRSWYTIDAPAAIGVLKQLAKEQFPDKELLRVYWYDAAPGKLPTAEQKQIGELEDVTLRLGDRNYRGEQKGVDSLIVLDLYDLALAKAVSDCVLIGGDADLTEGVSRSKAHGVRVTVWSFNTERPTTAPSLREAADRHMFLDAGLVKDVFKVTGNGQPGNGHNGAGGGTTRGAIATFPVDEALVAAAREAGRRFARRISPSLSAWQVQEVARMSPFVPSDIDARLIRFTAETIGPEVEVLPKEAVIAMREAFVSELALLGTEEELHGH